MVCIASECDFIASKLGTGEGRRFILMEEEVGLEAEP
jgi:hypothetical protein